MEETRNPNLDPQIFAQRSGNFFTSFGLPSFTSAEEASGFIEAIDQVVDILAQRLASENATFSDELVFDLGSALGEAFRTALNATEWRYSPKQNRWVIAGRTTTDDIEFNVFNKLEKRIANGMEDSIWQYYQGVCSYLAGELAI